MAECPPQNNNTLSYEQRAQYILQNHRKNFNDNGLPLEFHKREMTSSVVGQCIRVGLNLKACKYLNLIPIEAIYSAVTTHVSKTKDDKNTHLPPNERSLWNSRCFKEFRAMLPTSITNSAVNYLIDMFETTFFGETLIEQFLGALTCTSLFTFFCKVITALLQKDEYVFQNIGKAAVESLVQSIIPSFGIVATNGILVLVLSFCVYVAWDILRPILISEYESRTGLFYWLRSFWTSSRTQIGWDSTIDVPVEMTCPLSHALFFDSVELLGTLYERECIRQWIILKGTCPLSRKTVNLSMLEDAPDMRRLCFEFAISNNISATYEN